MQSVNLWTKPRILLLIEPEKKRLLVEELLGKKAMILVLMKLK